MKFKLTISLVLIMSLVATLSAKDLTGVKIYINPGHGGYDNTPGVLGDDRFVPTIPFPEESEDAFWESSCNLVKGLELKRLLEAAGATVKISRTTNTTADDKVLSSIDTEANNFGADAFISIHSNQLGTNSGTNYFLNLYNADYDADKESYGYIGKTQDLINECITMATQSAEYFKNNNLTVWDSSSSFIIKEDYPFLLYTLGVLRTLKVPGFVLEGSFHDYEPETHRLLNDDYVKLTAWNLYRFYCDYFGADKPLVGVIAGSMKDGAVEMSHEYYNNWKDGTHDRFQPINGAVVTLLNSKGETVETYTTDDYYNGVFVFWNLVPGTYTVKMEAEGYDTRVKEVTVTASETTSFVELMYKETSPNIIATSVRGVQSGSDYDITFALNRNATRVALKLYDVNGSFLEKIELDGNFKKGENKVRIDLNRLGEYKNIILKWSIEAEAESESKWRCVSAIVNGHDAVPEEQLTSYPNAVVVDNNPKSDYFGRIYMLNGTTVYSGKYKTLNVGVYAYNPVDFSMINENFEPYTGNVNWADKVGVSKKYVSLSPHTMAIDDEGYVYISDWTDYNSGVWIMNPSNPEGDFIPVFNVGVDDGGKVYNDEGKYVHGSVSGICVLGSGANRVLYTVDEDYSGGTAILKYAIGELTNLPYTGEPEVVYLLKNNEVLDASLNSYLAPDRKGGFWFAQRNYNESVNSTPYFGSFNLLHFTSKGYDEGLGMITDYYSRTTKESSINTLGLATNIDGSRLAIGVYAAVGMKTVEFNGDGTVVGSSLKDASGEYIPGYDKTMTMTAGNMMNHMTWGVAFDSADNLYVADWSDHFQAYALGKNENIHETRSKYQIDMFTVGLEDVNPGKTSVRINGNILNVISCVESDCIDIYNMAGILLYSAKMKSDRHSIDISSWQNGVYIVKTSESVTKVIK